MNRDDEDRIWLEVLRGRAAGGGDPALQREARLLRASLLARTSDRAEDVAATDLRREEALVARARHAGLLRPRRTGVPAFAWFGVAGWNVGVAAASLALVTVALGLVLFPVHERETVRGALAGVVRLEADDPPRLQRELLDELRAAGVDSTGYELLGRHGIDAELPRPIPPAIRRLLERHRIPPPEDGVLRVEIAPRAGP